MPFSLAELTEYLRIAIEALGRYRLRTALSVTGVVLGVTPAFQQILRLGVARGRFMSETDEATVARVTVIGSGLARELFGYRDPLDDTITVASDHYRVIGVLREQGTDPQAGSTMGWHNINRAAFVPLPTLTGHTLAVAPNQPVDEVWIQVAAGERSEELGEVFRRMLLQTREPDEFSIVVPRELLAQRYRTQRTFSVVVGSVAALVLLIGGIGIMNIMLTAVVERTREIGVRRTVGARRRWSPLTRCVTNSRWYAGTDFSGLSKATNRDARGLQPFPY